jgi:hypothetical protein
VLRGEGGSGRQRCWNTPLSMPKAAGFFTRSGGVRDEIGAQLFIGTRIVEYHLHKVFTKLEISSRNELGRVLPSEAREAQAV